MAADLVAAEVGLDCFADLLLLGSDEYRFGRADHCCLAIAVC